MGVTITAPSQTDQGSSAWHFHLFCIQGVFQFTFAAPCAAGMRGAFYYASGMSGVVLMMMALS